MHALLNHAVTLEKHDGIIFVRRKAMRSIAMHVVAGSFVVGMAHEARRNISTFFGRGLHTCRNLLEQAHTARLKARISSVLKHANYDGHAARAVIALGKIQRQQSERRRAQKLAGLVHIVSILLGHQPGNIGRVLFQHANERLS